VSKLATQPARASGEFAIGGDLPVVRLGYGSMQIPGPGVWGEPPDHDEVIRVLRRALELGVTFIDTADSYGPAVSERLIREALHPYPDDLVIATKAGLTRPGPGVWGEPRDHDEVIRVLHRAIELGVTFIDTADSYGPEVSERLIREALHPYPDEQARHHRRGAIHVGDAADEYAALVTSWWGGGYATVESAAAR